MMLKEKTAENNAPSRKKTEANRPPRGAVPALTRLAPVILCCAAGFCFGGAFGGSGIPLCVPLISVLDPLCGLCVFIGAAASYIAAGLSGSFLTDIAAMPVMLGIRFFRGKDFSPTSAAVISGTVYVVSGAAAAVTAKITGALLAAVFFRGVICGIVAYFASECAGELHSEGKISVTGEKAAGTAVLYVVVSAALNVVRLGNFCPARAAGIFVILAAGGRFGGGGAAAAGALTALGVILGEGRGTDLSDMIRSSAIISCSGLISGCFSRRSRTAASVSFAVSALLLSLFMGRISHAAALMTDTLISAALYCLIPDRLYMRAVNSAVKRSSAPAECCSRSLAFTAETVRGINESITKAAKMLAEINGGSDYDPSEEICSRICSECRSDTFCCKGNLHRRKYIFPDAVHILNVKGYITEKELPKALEGCSKKAELAELLNEVCRRTAIEKRLAGFSVQLRENMSEQLSALGDILGGIGESFGGEKIHDASLSESAEKIIRSAGAENASVSVFFDSAGHIYISCFYKDSLDISPEIITGQLSRLTDRDLEPPEAFSENGVTRLRWHEAADFVCETGKAAMNGRESVSGDCSSGFSDGLGNMYFIISDGMGSGSRAALESSMTVSVLTRLIKSGIGAAAAVKLVNLILLSKDPDEVLSTVDLLKINLFSGRADMIKAGAAQTFFRTGGSVKTIESRTLPVGIIAPAEFEEKTLHLADGDCAVMLSDGIRGESLAKARELILSEGYSSQDCADRIMEYDCEKGKPPFDDRTVLVVKLHKI